MFIETSLTRGIGIHKVKVNPQLFYQGITSKLFSPSDAKVFRKSLGINLHSSRIVENIDFEVRLGILKAKYKRVFRSTKVAKHPLLFPREEMTVSNSQWRLFFLF